MQFKDIVVSEKYTTKQGEEKTKYTNIGTLFVYDDGGMSVKLDVVPVNWDGKASVYEKKARQPQQPTNQNIQNGSSQYAGTQQVPVIDMGSQDIPF